MFELFTHRLSVVITIYPYNTVFLSDKVLIIDPMPAFSVKEACNLSTIAP